MDPWLYDVFRTIVGAWVYSLIFEKSFTVVTMVAIVLGVSIYQFIRPLALVIFKNYRKEPYHGPREDR
jgi:hypothetical protein